VHDVDLVFDIAMHYACQNTSGSENYADCAAAQGEGGDGSIQPSVSSIHFEGIRGTAWRSGWLRCLADAPCRDVTFAQIEVTATEPFLCEHVHATGLPGGWHCPEPDGPVLKRPRSSEFRLSNTLGDHMVLQRSSNKTCVWGFADPGDVITTVFQGQTFTVPTAVDGVWRQYLPAQLATMQPQTLSFRSSSGATASLTDVLFGDVFLAGGGSSTVQRPNPESLATEIPV
jgi:hypothetical protein